jgi:hypothetical protein
MSWVRMALAVRSVAMLSLEGALGPAGAAPLPVCCIEADAESIRTRLHTIAMVRI